MSVCDFIQTDVGITKKIEKCFCEMTALAGLFGLFVCFTSRQKDMRSTPEVLVSLRRTAYPIPLNAIEDLLRLDTVEDLLVHNTQVLMIMWEIYTAHSLFWSRPARTRP